MELVFQVGLLKQVCIKEHGKEGSRSGANFHLDRKGRRNSCVANSA